MKSSIRPTPQFFVPGNPMISEWEKALREFLDPWERKSNIIGAIATGSRVAGVATEYSDVDVHIILSGKTKWRERGLKNVNGFVIEYFANPMRQLKKYMETDLIEGRRHCARMFALGVIVFDKTGAAKELQRLGKRDMRRPLPKLSRSLVENAKYSVWDGLDELRALNTRKFPGFAYASYAVLHQLLKSYTRFLGAEMWAVGKMWQFLSSPEYRQKQQIAPFPDQDFVKMFLRALDDPTLKRIEKLTSYVHQKMGGFHVDSWKVRTQVE